MVYLEGFNQDTEQVEMSMGIFVNFWNSACLKIMYFSSSFWTFLTVSLLVLSPSSHLSLYCYPFFFLKTHIKICPLFENFQLCQCPRSYQLKAMFPVLFLTSSFNSNMLITLANWPFPE